MNINWQDIYHFLMVAECGTLSEAARRLGTSQPTLSRRIEALEASLGCNLFKRHARGLQLTPEGETMVEEARQMMQRAANIERLARGKLSAMEGEVRLALPEGLCNEIVAPALEPFLARYPQLRLLVGVSPQAADLLHGEADIALRLYRPHQPDLVVRKLGEMTMGLYASRRYLDVHAAPCTPSDLQGHKVIAYGEGLRHLAENQWLLSHATEKQSVLSSDSTSCRLQATRHGLGISIQPTMIAAHYPELVALFEGSDIPGHEIWLTYHKDLARSERIRLVVKLLVEAVDGAL